MRTDMLNETMPLIPAGKLPLVKKALHAKFGVTEVEQAEFLTGGLSTALVYRIAIDGKDYVLRMILQVHPFNDPVRQFHCMKLAADAGIAPAVHYADAGDGITIMDFIPTSWPEGPPQTDALIQTLVGTVKSIHELPLFPPLINFLDGIDEYIERFHASGTLPPEATAEHFRYYAQIQDVYPRHDPDLVSSHNDLNPNNLIVSGTRLWVIDWETAYRNDRYVDLANVANFFLPDPVEQEAYLRAYFGEKLGNVERARFFLMQQVCQMYYAMGIFSMASHQLPPGGTFDPDMETPSPIEFHTRIQAEQLSYNDLAVQVMFGKVQLNEMLRAMKTARFADAVSILQSWQR